MPRGVDEAVGAIKQLDLHGVGGWGAEKSF